MAVKPDPESIYKLYLVTMDPPLSVGSKTLRSSDESDEVMIFAAAGLSGTLAARM
jgi:hypothetical protein